MSKCWKQEKSNWKCLDSSSQDSTESGSTGLSGGAPDSVRCAPDCPVRPTTEGKDGLLDLFSTAPSCLGAIKGTPRRMEENTKHSYNTPEHQDIDSTHLVHCDSI